MVNNALKAMSKEDLEKYKKVGEQLYGSVNFEDSTVVNKLITPADEAVAYIEEGLKSGLMPDDLDENEVILLQILSFFIIIYTSVLVFIGVREVHNYEIKETFKNILLTIFTMFLIVLICFIVYVFGSQLIEFLVSWVKEVFFRVFK
jgi:magnesium-transporting ATPase (P-type)